MNIVGVSGVLAGRKTNDAERAGGFLNRLAAGATAAALALAIAPTVLPSINHIPFAGVDTGKTSVSAFGAAARGMTSQSKPAPIMVTRPPVL